MNHINSINPNIWGPSGWKFLHYVSLGYPDNPNERDKQNYKNFFYSLSNVIPCQKCSNNLKQNLNDYPIDNSLSNRESLSKWVIDIHNSVNQELNKPTFDYETALDLYPLTNTNYTNNKSFKFIILLFILICIYFILKK
tara:strand:- start:88 stop:504 length:417 start_codon:yes stop_codon:yes gene_type:complete